MTGRFMATGLVALVAIAAYAWWPASSANPSQAPRPQVTPMTDSILGGAAKPDETGMQGRVSTHPSPAPRFTASAGPNLFPVQSFRPPPRIQAAARVVAPPPMAPDLPFAYMGAWSEQGRETVFLSQGDAVLNVHVGDDLPGGWRLDSVDPESLTFTYVSLNQQRNLRIAP